MSHGNEDGQQDGPGPYGRAEWQADFARQHVWRVCPRKACRRYRRCVPHGFETGEGRAYRCRFDDLEAWEARIEALCEGWPDEDRLYVIDSLPVLADGPGDPPRGKG